VWIEVRLRCSCCCCKTVKPCHNALTVSDKSKLFPSGKATNICVSQKDLAQSCVIPPIVLADVSNSTVKQKTTTKLTGINCVVTLTLLAPELFLKFLHTLYLKCE
jgi:hypothetical protein